MGLTPFEYFMSAATIASSVFGAASQHKATKANIAGAEEAKKTTIKQAQVNAEKPPEQATEVASKQAIKKRPEQWGMEESIINNNLMASAGNNTIGQKEVWGA